MLAGATGGDNKAKGLYDCMGLTVYRSLPTDTKEQVKQCLWSGEIVLTATSGSVPKKQSVIERNILDIVVKDTAVDRISRMVRINTKVHKCVRDNGEYIKGFIYRIKMPYFAYLKILRADYHYAESKIFSMKLIINATLGEQLLDNTIISLINGLYAWKQLRRNISQSGRQDWNL